MAEQIRVAIVGGSIAGCTLANGLLRHSNVVFDIFESRPTFTERGASVGLADNAIHALRAMGVDVDQAMKRAGAMRMTSTTYLVGVGEHKGKRLFELPGGVISVMRNRWLEELLRGLPKDRLHSNKKLISITEPVQAQNAYTLRFEDGSTYEVDAVIGCDGIRSKVREIVLGSDSQALFGGYWDARGKLTPKRAAEQFGTELFNPMEPSEVALIGEGASMLFVPNSTGEVYNVIVAGAAGPNFDKTSWKTKLSREYLEEAYEGWDEKFMTAVIEILMAADSGPGVVFSQFESQEVSTYYRDRLCMIGDSAHATVPWLGQGACMAIEDASVLAALLGSVRSVDELEMALMAFDQTRRGRPENVMRQSREAAKVLTGQLGLNPSKIAKLEVSKWWEQVWAFDMNAHIQKAIGRFNCYKMTQDV